MRNLILILLVLALGACGTKRQYFQPQKTDGKAEFSKKLSSKIKDYNIFSARLANHKIFFKDQPKYFSFKFEKNYMLLAFKYDELVLADNNGNLKIFNSQGEKVYEHKFDASVLSASLDGDDLALVLADNTIIWANRSLGVRFSQTLSQSLIQDNRVAAPIFMENEIAYPTLDGKVVFLSKNKLVLSRDFVISVDNFFNNVIHLSEQKGKIIAATAKNIVVLNGEKNGEFDDEIKEVVTNNGEIFIFTKNGKIIKTDLKLNKIKEKKFDFALFIKADIFNDTLWAVEKTGYLFKSDLNLEQISIYELGEKIKDKSFLANGNFYYKNKVLELK